MGVYLLGRDCADCGAERGEPCRSKRKGGRKGEPLTGYHDSRKRPADLLSADAARFQSLRSNEAGTCLLCGRTIPASFSRWRIGDHFCTGACAQRFGVIAARNDFRLVERESIAQDILEGRAE